jgi:hypothetical protein
MTSRPSTQTGLLLAALLLPLAASALIMTGRGNDPLPDAGWPEGALAVANLSVRVGWWEGPPFGGGQWQFQYRGDTAAFAQALAAFAAIRAPALEVVLHDGPQEGAFLNDRDQPQLETRIDWAFTVWNPASWHRLFNDPTSVFLSDQPSFRRPVDPPRLDVYLGGGTVDWAQVTVPPGLRLRDERATAAGVEVTGGALVHVEVYAMATGKPVPGARLRVERQAAENDGRATRYDVVSEAVSDANGRGQLGQLPAGTLRLSVGAPGYALRALGGERYGERTFRQYTVELAGAASVRGVVQDTAGQPVASVRVRADNSMALDGRGYGAPTPAEALTDAAGRFELAGLAAGYTQLRVRAPGYTSGDSTIHRVPATDVVIRVGQTGRIAVSVVDAQGQPLATLKGNPIMVEVEPKGGARVGTWGGSAQVKNDGTCEFTEVWPDEYRVSSRPNPGSGGVSSAPDPCVRLEPGGQVEIKLVYAAAP